MKITSQLLKSMYACEDQLELFKKVFPEGAEINQENCELAIANKLNVIWLLMTSTKSLPYTGHFTQNHNTFYYQDGLRHRTDGPAVEYANGRKEWWNNGQRHRTDGPAIEFSGGSKQWYLNGQRHREDGPAVEWINEGKEWWINGRLQKITSPEIDTRE